MKDNSTLAIEVQNVTKCYNGKPVLQDISLEIERGEFYILMGPNGSGKSTLLSIIAGTNPVDSGSVRIMGHDMNRKKLQARQHIGYVPQENFCSAFLTGRENLRYFARLLGLKGSGAKEHIDHLLEMMDLLDAADRRAGQYSGGMRKKLEVATALLGDTSILLLDEPSTGLDPRVRKDFLRLLCTINKQGTTILLVTHIGEDAEMASRIGFMVDGEILVEDTPEVLKEKSGVQSSVIIDAAPRNQELSLLLASLDGDCIVIEQEEGFMITCDRAVELIPVIIDVLKEAGYEVLSVDTNPPTLEDVFYRMTEIPVRGEA